MTIWKKRLSEPAAAVLVALGMTLLAFLEVLFAPWRPWFFGFAALSVALPIWLGAYRFGALKDMRLLVLGLAIFGGLALQIAAGVIVGLLYPAVLAGFGIDEVARAGPYYALEGALRELFALTAGRLDASADAVQGLYLTFIFLWAGLGEELFYRGYVYGKIRAGRGVLPAALISALFFAIRHGVQLAPLAPAYPWGAAAIWVAVSFLVGLVFAVLYERSRSLYLPMAVHYMFNLIPLLGVLSASGAS